MFPLIGSGKYITAPVITEKGDPIRDPLVILETNMGNGDAAHTTASGGSRARILEMEKETNKKIIRWKLKLHQIGLDVKRTDRILVFYEKHENLDKLWDILPIYSWIDEDVGYCQDDDVMGVDETVSEKKSKKKKSNGDANDDGEATTAANGEAAKSEKKKKNKYKNKQEEDEEAPEELKSEKKKKKDKRKLEEEAERAGDEDGGSKKKKKKNKDAEQPDAAEDGEGTKKKKKKKYKGDE